MKWLIKIVQISVLAHILWAGATGLVVTLTSGEAATFPFAFMGHSYIYKIYGVPGEALFTWPFHIAIFLNRLLYLYAFYRLWKLFGAFAQRQYFSKRAIGHLYGFTGLFTLFTLSRIAISWIFAAVSSNPLLESVNIGVSLYDLADLGYPILLFIIAHILKEARKNEQELADFFSCPS